MSGEGAENKQDNIFIYYVLLSDKCQKEKHKAEKEDKCVSQWVYVQRDAKILLMLPSIYVTKRVTFK